MLIKRGKGEYCYKSIRINGQPKSIYLGKSSSPQAREHERKKQEKEEYKDRERQLADLSEVANHAMHTLRLMVRGYLILAGYYERKSEIRKLQEEGLCTTPSSCNSNL